MSFSRKATSHATSPPSLTTSSLTAFVTRARAGQTNETGKYVSSEPNRWVGARRAGNFAKAHHTYDILGILGGRGVYDARIYVLVCMYK